VTVESTDPTTGDPTKTHMSSGMDNINQTISDKHVSLIRTPTMEPTMKKELLKKITSREAGHFDLTRMLIIVGLFLALTVISLFRRDKSLDHELHIPKCGYIDWTLFAV
jgi:hypothetical protein